MNLKSFAALAGVLALAACGDNGQNPDALKGNSFVSSTGTTDIVLTFAPDEMRVSGSVVNLYNGAYTVTDETITFGPMATTMMMGEPDAMQTEQEYLQFLNTVNAYELDGETLVLTNPDGKEIIFTMVEVNPNAVEPTADEAAAANAAAATDDGVAAGK